MRCLIRKCSGDMRVCRDAGISLEQLGRRADFERNRVSTAQQVEQSRAMREHGKRGSIKPVCAGLSRASAQFDPDSMRVCGSARVPCFGVLVDHGDDISTVKDVVSRRAPLGGRSCQIPRACQRAAGTLLSICAVDHCPQNGSTSDRPSVWCVYRNELWEGRRCLEDRGAVAFSVVHVVLSRPWTSTIKSRKRSR